jgi:glycosyltransferase involved in cell wall biosynthesis
VLELLRAADVLVQPGSPGPFNDYRFPSKLPDFLASGHPVILPASNIAHELDAGSAVVLQSGSTDEISAAIAHLVDDEATATAIGAAGRQFALTRLTWSRAAEIVEGVYRTIGVSHTQEASASKERDGRS